MAWRLDGMKNFLSRLGFKGDKSRANSVDIAGVRLLSDEELAAVWIGDGLGKKIVSIRAADALSQGFEFPNDTDGVLFKELRRLDAIPVLKRALSWADLFGGCMILPMVQDGQPDLSYPLAFRNKMPVTQLRVYDRTRVLSIATSWVNDPMSPYFEDVEDFQLRKLDGTTFHCHATRLICLKGEPVPQNTYLNNLDLRWWGQSMLQPIFQDLAAYGTSFQAVAHLMQECSIAKYRFPEVTALLSQGAEGETKVMNRMELMNLGKSVMQGVLLGEGEEYIRENIPMGEISQAMNVFKENVQAVTGFPGTRIFGSSPGGLNATGESDMNNHYDNIRDYQEHYVYKAASDLFLRIARGIGLPDNVAEFTFKPLGAPTQEQLVTMRSTQATTDKTYVDMGVLDADEVREARFFQRASLETTVDTANAPEKEPPLDQGPEPNPQDLENQNLPPQGKGKA